MTNKYFLALTVYCTLCTHNPARAEIPQTDANVSITFVGDIMLDELPGKLIKQGQDPFAHFAHILDASDIRIANLECVIATRGEAEPEKPYTFRAHPRTLKILTRHFDALALANNHTGDFGPDAFNDMLNRLEQQGIPYFGAGRNLAQAHKPLIIMRKGLRIAFLSYNEFFPRSFEADFDKPGIAWSENEQVKLDIHNARAQYHADIVIPFMHWGWEHQPLASQRQHQLARLMIEAGADAVVGGHPHVTQEIEFYRGKPVIYSLGNFVFNGFSDKDSNTGWLLHMEIDHNGVQKLQTFVAHIDQQGIPHPSSTNTGLCWNIKAGKETVCTSK